MEDLTSIGTEFQVKVWKEIAKIPYGETRTYKELAIAIGKPKSSRAVANRTNPMLCRNLFLFKVFSGYFTHFLAKLKTNSDS